MIHTYSAFYAYDDESGAAYARHADGRIEIGLANTRFKAPACEDTLQYTLASNRGGGLRLVPFAPLGAERIGAIQAGLVKIANSLGFNDDAHAIYCAFDLLEGLR